jgi:hypothetical protein
MIKNILVFTFLLFSISYSQSDTLLIFSEIMFYPASSNSEFIEIYNLSSSQTIDLSNYKIKYSTSTPDQIIDTGSGTMLLPNSYAVIFENDYDIASGIYSGLVPATALNLKIADNSFGSTGMANTTSRPLWLLNAANDTVDYYFYSADNSSAISDEKIILNHDSSQTNWANSLVTNGTPGFTNSVSPTNYDLQIMSLTFSPSNPIAGSDVTITTKIKNGGILNAASYTLEIFNDANKNSVGEISEKIFSQTFSNLSPSDSLIASTILTSLPADTYQIIAQINFVEDQNPANNNLINQFTVSPPGYNFNDVIINEIMYAPSTGEPEWIELYNRTEESVNLKNWKLSDASTTISITAQDRYIPAKSFIVISKDATISNFYSVPSEILVTNIPSLNNTGDALVIRDFNNILIDSVYYLPDWGGNIGGNSLERIDNNISSNASTNWKTSKSIFKATPGEINSVTQKDFDVSVSNILFNPSYPILGNNVNISAVIKNIGKNSAQFSAELYEDTNLDSIPDSFVESISNLSLSVGDSSIYQFSYSIQDIKSKEGFYAKILFAQDQDTTNNYFYKIVEPGYPRQTLVINEIMYDPDSDNSEYVEFYNISSDYVDVDNWKFEDENENVNKLIDTSFIIPPQEYFVLIADSSTVIKFNLFDFKYKNVLDVSSLGLVNTGELILLKDKRGNVIDSVFYSDKWNNKNIASTKGKSLERINPNLNGNDPLNWSTSVNSLGGTPGKTNSIFSENLNISASLTINPNPFSPDNDGFEDFTVINYNLSQPIAQVRIKIFDSKGRLVRTLLNNQASGSNGSVIFDGLDDSGKALRMGIYIIFLEALNDNSGVVETVKSVVVVARKL